MENIRRAAVPTRSVNTDILNKIKLIEFKCNVANFIEANIWNVTIGLQLTRKMGQSNANQLTARAMANYKLAFKL